MKPTTFSYAILFLENQFEEQEFDEGEKIDFLKLLQYAAMIEADTDDEIPPIVLRGFKELSKERSRFIVYLRNSQSIAFLSLKDELFVYRMLSKIYRHQ